jgi:hypothetical protein
MVLWYIFFHVAIDAYAHEVNWLQLFLVDY